MVVLDLELLIVIQKIPVIVDPRVVENLTIADFGSVL